MGVVGPDLAPDLFGKGGERQQIIPGAFEVFGIDAAGASTTVAVQLSQVATDFRTSANTHILPRNRGALLYPLL